MAKSENIYIKSCCFFAPGPARCWRRCSWKLLASVCLFVNENDSNKQTDRSKRTIEDAIRLGRQNIIRLSRVIRRISFISYLCHCGTVRCKTSNGACFASIWPFLYEHILRSPTHFIRIHTSTHFGWSSTILMERKKPDENYTRTQAMCLRSLSL